MKYGSQIYGDNPVPVNRVRIDRGAGHCDSSDVDEHIQVTKVVQRATYSFRDLANLAQITYPSPHVGDQSPRLSRLREPIRVHVNQRSAVSVFGHPKRGRSANP
jgi:hypothetical protein